MSEVAHNPAQIPTILPQRTTVVARPSWRVRKAAKAIDDQTAVELLRLDRQNEVGTERARTVARVGMKAMEAQSIVSMTERMIVEMEPGSINGVSYISQKITMGLGQVVDKTIDEVTR